tara:strand:+ start:220 stop:624 length:405 start_codon:yes stop_codon:yes gene_type:complete
MINKNIRDENIILQNGVRFADGTEIFSRHRHDFVSHEGYAVDGGQDYIRRVGTMPEGAEDISVFLDEDHEINREYFRWGTYGPTGSEELRWKKLCDMSTNHIHAIMEKGLTSGWRLELFEQELIYRCDKDLANG